jgi:hypothetical protein
VTVNKPLRTSRLPSAALALFALAALVGLPACETGTGIPSITGPANAQIAVSLDPASIVGTQNSVTKAVKVEFDVKLQELNGLGCAITFVNASIFEPASGAQVAQVYFDAADLVVYVGSQRVEAQGTLVVPETLSYALADGSKEATVVVSVQAKDDRGNLINRSVMAQIQ